MALRRLPPPRRHRATHRLARHPGVVRCDRTSQPRPRRSTGPPRLVGAARCDGHRRVAVRAPRSRVPVRLAGLVRPSRRTRPTHRVRGPHHAGDRRRRPVHRRPLEAGHHRVDRRHHRCARHVDAADLHRRLRRRGVDDLRPARRRHRTCIPVPVRLEGRPRPPTKACGPGPARHLRRARQARPRRAWRHGRVRRRTAPAARRTRPSPATRRRRTGSDPPHPSRDLRRPRRPVDRAARARRRQRQLPLVHRQRRVGRQRHRDRSVQGSAAPRPAARADRRHGRAGQGDPRTRRPRPRTRTDPGRTRTRRRRGLPRHRARRTAATGHRADRTGTVDPEPGEHQR